MLFHSSHERWVSPQHDPVSQRAGVNEGFAAYTRRYMIALEQRRESNNRSKCLISVNLYHKSFNMALKMNPSFLWLNPQFATVLQNIFCTA